MDKLEIIPSDESTGTPVLIAAALQVALFLTVLAAIVGIGAG